MMSQPNRGIIDALSRVLEQILLKPSFKDDLRALIQNIDPENSPRLIKAIMGTDIEVPLSLVSSLPAIANIFIKTTEELIRQVNESFPAPVLQAFTESLLAEVDHVALANAVNGAKRLGRDLSPVFAEALKKLESVQAAPPKEIAHE